MALPKESFTIVEQWKMKSYEIATASNDCIAPLLSKGIETMSLVLNSKADLNRVQRALVSLDFERSVSLQFDNLKNDEIRSLVYGLIESLHFTLSELNNERNQVKECGEMFTQTDQELSQPSLDFLSSNEYSDQSRDEPIIPSLLEYPKEEVFDENAFKIEDLWGDAMEIKDEEMPNDDVETYNDNNDIVGYRGDIATIVDNNDSSQSEALNIMGADFENEDIDETKNDSHANEDMARDRGDVSNIMHNDDRAQSEMPALDYMGDESHFENEGFNETVNDSKENENMGEDREQDSSEPVEIEKNRRSSRNKSKPVKYADCGSQHYSDEDSEPVKKRSKMKKSSVTMEKKGGSVTSKRKSRKMKCTECEYRTSYPGSFTHHLRYVHITTLGLAGLALRCDCGVEALSEAHGRECDIANFTVVRKRDGPIQTFNDAKKTPQCLLCEAYPKTARGYIHHLGIHHSTVLSAQGIFLQCSCGAKYRQCHPDSKHTAESVMALPEESISMDELSCKKEPPLIVRALEYPLPSNNSSNTSNDHSRDEPPIIPNLFELIKEEPINEGEIKIEDPWGDEISIKEEEISNDDVDDCGVISSLSDNDDMRISSRNVPSPVTLADRNSREYSDGEYELTMKPVEMEKKRRSSRNVSRPVKYADCESLDISDEDSEPVMKRSKIKKKKSSDTVEKKYGTVSSRGKLREMKCTECEFQTTSAGTFTHHLRYVHSTTLVLAGLALRCACGIETISNKHRYKCDIANFTVITKRDGPIQTFNDEKTTPQCIMCEVYPRTPDGYIRHLYLHHKSSLSYNGIYLLCSCGAKYRHNYPDSKHTKECIHREFTLHKIDNK